MSQSNIISVTDYGAVGDDSNDDTLAIQKAFDVYATSYADYIYFPQPTSAYKITSTIKFDSRTSVCGSTKGKSSGSLIKVYAAIPAFQARTKGSTNTRDVHFSDLSIDSSYFSPSTMTQPSGSPPSVTISGNYTSVYTGIVKITLGGSRGTATFKYSLNGGSTWSADITTAASYAIGTTGLTLTFGTGTYVLNDQYTWYTVAATGSIGLDFTDVSQSQIVRCSFRIHDTGIKNYDTGGVIGAYYNSYYDNELVNCNYGYDFYLAGGNASRIVGGRQYANYAAGVRIRQSVGIAIHSAFEHNTPGVLFDDYATQCHVTHSYFEGNTCSVRFSSLANSCIEEHNLLSNATDYIDDQSSGRGNYSRSTTVPSSPSTGTGYGNGTNLFINGGFEVDSDSDGIADGVYIYSKPATTTLSLDGTIKRSGSYSQKIYINNTSNRTIDRYLNLKVGVRYVFTGYTYIDTTGLFALRAGTNAGDSSYYNSSALTTTNTWQMHRFSFVATSATADIYIYEVNPAGTGSIYLDDWKLEVGHLPTENCSDELEHRRTSLGNTIASASTITLTHRIHRISGTSTINTINVPDGFSGEVILIPTGAFTLGTSGNIKLASSLTATVDQPIIIVWDPMAAYYSTQDYHQWGRWYVR